jgi:hypothetical protein
MRCPDDSDQSGKVRIRVLDSDAAIQRNADPDADAGLVVRCCAVQHLTSVPDPRLKPRTASFLKLNCKKHERIHQKVGADPNFFQKYHV